MQAADEERRRIGRDLHDGAQQRLVALGHLIGLARRKAGDLPPAAAELLDGAAEQAQLASGELRGSRAACTRPASASAACASRSRPWRRARRWTCTWPRCPSAGCRSRSS